MKLTLLRIAAVAFLVVAAAGISWTKVGNVALFNSEEHRLIADRGAAAVVIPASVNFPPLGDGTQGIGFKSLTRPQYVANIKRAKQLAVGGLDYDKWAVAQDNCYFERAGKDPVLGTPVGPNIFGQLDYNENIWVVPEAAAPPKVLIVPGRSNSGRPWGFTFGELVAFYGDYRQLPYCDGAGCYMTHGNINRITFVWPANLKYCPEPLTEPGEYLSAIASGLVPPVGAGGNVFSNTASSITEYTNAGWWGDEMMRIATVNDWHFSNVAVAWYVGMHRLALLYADSARAEPAYWYKALHYEANALHSLTDLFAFGHVVTAGDEVSFDVATSSNILGKDPYNLFAHTLELGGGHRETNGRLSLGRPLPELIAKPIARNTVQETHPRLNYPNKKDEKDYHDDYNKLGGTVKNLRGDQFEIYGDKFLAKMMSASGGASVAIEAVTASLQSLFNSYDKLTRGASVAELSRDTSFFAALRLIPAYVVNGPYDYFEARWTSYADAINQLSGAGRHIQGEARCYVQYVSGKSSKPQPVTGGPNVCPFQ
jgi:hypothetical protein